MQKQRNIPSPIYIYDRDAHKTKKVNSSKLKLEKPDNLPKFVLEKTVDTPKIFEEILTKSPVAQKSTTRYTIENDIDI